MKTDLPKIDLYVIQKYIFTLGITCIFGVILLTDLFGLFAPNISLSLSGFFSAIITLVITGFILWLIMKIALMPFIRIVISFLLELWGYRKKLKFERGDFWDAGEKSKEKYGNRSKKIILFRTDKNHIRTYVL